MNILRMQTPIFRYIALDNTNSKGIYINLKGKNHLVNPYILYSKLWNCAKQERLCKYIDVKYQIFSDEVCGHYFDAWVGYYYECYDRKSFIESAITSLRQMCQDVFNEIPNKYSINFMRKAYAERLIDGLDSIKIPRNYSQLFSADINVERFDFSFNEGYSCDSGFSVGFGDRFYRSCFSDWSNDLALIRHDLEGIVIRKEGSLELNFEDSPNIINIQSIYIHDTKDNTLAKVTFYPDAFVGGPIIFGYFKFYQIIQQIYEGFIGLFEADTNLFENDDIDSDWETFRLRCLAIFKSDIVENYLKNNENR